ncbi:MAG: molybdopterin synthase sulfur carrier subunit [Planctomycetaceae bacterium]|nr:molybdopterin synthase sulfur carrier subunit [Planctomycetaceae bacterium]
MKIQLKLMGVLKDKTPEDGSLELVDGSTVEDTLRALDIDTERVQVFTVNGSLERDRARVLAEGDELSVIPPVGGG